jgi:hypothetical protein
LKTLTFKFVQTYVNPSLRVLRQFPATMLLGTASPLISRSGFINALEQPTRTNSLLAIGTKWSMTTENISHKL